VALSLLAWSIPQVPGLLRGFTKPELVDGLSFSILFIWYGSIYATARVGFLIGRSTEPRYAAPPAMRENLTYKVFVAIAVVGTLAAYLVIYRSGALGLYISAPSNLSANILKEALYNDYSIGVLSFRYVSVIAASLALTRFFKGHPLNVLDVVSLMTLLAAAFITGRILVTWTVILTAGLITGPFTQAKKRRPVKALIPWAAAALLVLWGLNYSRNGLYYQTEGANFLTGGLSEAVTYLGTPMQVSIGVANQWGQSRITSDDKDKVDHEPSLTTNSAFSELYSEIGALAFGAINLQAFAFSLLAGWASKQRSIYVYMVYPLVSYGFAEIWRADLLRTGMFICLTAIAMVVPIGLATAYPRKAARTLQKPVGAIALR
jgi:hypothetical protein